MTSPALDRVVGMCLEKDPEARWQTAHDLGTALKWIAEGSPEAGAPGLAAARLPSRVRLAWGLSILIAVLVTGITVRSVVRPAPRLPTRLAVTLPATDRLVTSSIALSADGRDLAYIGERNGVTQLYRRSMNQLEAVPFFSPDGQWVGFSADGKLKKVSLAGGQPVTLCDAGFFNGASWGPNDVITFAFRNSGLMRVSASGGAPEPVTTLENEESRHSLPDILPGGKAVLFTVGSGGGLETARIAVQSLETGERRNLVDGTNPRYAPTGHIVFARANSLWVVPFDAKRLEVTGAPTKFLEGVLYASGVPMTHSPRNKGFMARELLRGGGGSRLPAVG